MINDPVVGNSYKNIKTGNVYVVLSVNGKHSETGEELVTYRLKGDGKATWWHRPLNLFREKFILVEKPSLVRSVEHLFHYRCGACEKWWAIADIEPREGEVIDCPHCGYPHVIEGRLLTGDDFNNV